MTTRRPCATSSSTPEAIEMASDRTRADLDSDRMLELSLPRLVEIVGEAAARISDETREAHAGIPWREIIAMRNRLIHGLGVYPSDALVAFVREEEVAGGVQRHKAGEVQAGARGRAVVTANDSDHGEAPNGGAGGRRNSSFCRA